MAIVEELHYITRPSHFAYPGPDDQRRTVPQRIAARLQIIEAVTHNSRFKRPLSMLVVASLTCSGYFKQKRTIFDTCTWLSLAVDADLDTVNDLLRSRFRSETSEGPVRCECGAIEEQRTESLAKLPQYLMIQIMRYRGVDTKISKPYRLDINDLSLLPYLHSTIVDDRPSSYECVGAIEHKGDSLHTGH